MKSLFMLLFTVSTLVTSIQQFTQETETITATYIGSDNGEFFFAQGETKIAFQAVDAKVAEIVNLGDEALKGQVMQVTYSTETEENEDGELVEINTIVKLTPAK